MRPLYDYIVVKRLDAEEKKDSLIVMPSDAQENQPIGKVIAVGPGRFIDGGAERYTMTVKEGDIVLFYENASQKITLKGIEYSVMSETNVFLILDEGEIND